MLMLVVCSALVAATALVASARFAEGSASQWLVGAYVLAFGEVVGLTLVLSPFHAFRRSPVVFGLAVIFVATVVLVRGVQFPTVSAPLATFREPAVAILLAAVTGVVGYSLALGLFRPPNDQDALAYHLARAAFWTQQHALSFVPGAQNVAIDTYPPNAEIAMAFTMVTSGSGRYGPLVQLCAGLAAAVAIYGIARRVGFAVRESLLGALLFLTLPVVALQLGTGLNDVVVAALVAATAFFLLRGTTPNLVFAGLSCALLVGTKFTGLLALVVLSLVAVVARRHRLLPLFAVGALGAVVGAYWYAYAHLVPGEAPGEISDVRGPQAGVIDVIGRSTRLALAAFELPGAVGLDKLLYVVAAAVVIFLAARGRRARDVALAGALTVAPLLLVPVGHGLLRVTRKTFFELGHSGVGNLDSDRSATKASPIFSWYGPLGVLLTLLALVLAIRAVRRVNSERVVIVLAAAPILWIVLLSIAVPYQEWSGRFNMGAFALAAASWPIALQIRPVAWAAIAVAVVTVGLSFVHEHDRPSGLRLIEPTHEHSVWSQPDWSVEATDHPDFRAVLRYFDRNVPAHAHVGVEPSVFPPRSVLRGDMLPYAFCGTNLQRHVDLTDSAARTHASHDDWTVLRGVHARDCPAGWRVAFRYENWVVLKTTSAPRCRS
jgi:hypothetical protein